MSTITQAHPPLTRKNLEVSSHQPSAIPPHTPPFANPINKKLYNSSLLAQFAISSTDSLDTTSSTSTIKLNSTASSPSLPHFFQAVDPVDVPEPLAVPPPLLRKKSGELVKSSLKISSLLQKSMSTSNLPSSKSVRFASRLANIKHFDGLDSPSAVSSAQTTPLHSPPAPDGFSDDEEDDDDDDFDFDFSKKKLPIKLVRKKKSSQKSDYFQWNWNGEFSSHKNTSASDTSSDDELNYWYSASGPSNPSSSSGSAKSRKYKIESSNVQTHPQPGAPVILNSVKLLDIDNTTYLYGLINVQNLAFEKHLSIKLTLNNWQTNLNFSHKIISYLKSFQHSNVDQFQFKIPLSDLISHNNQSNNIKMCIKYTANHQTYWDNNNGKNYTIVLKASDSIRTYNYSKSSKKASSSEVDDSFPQYDELVTKLINFQNSSSDVGTFRDCSKSDTDSYGSAKKNFDDDYVLAKPIVSPKKSAYSRYNLMSEELDDLSKSGIHTPVVPIKFSEANGPQRAVRPPLMKHSFSASDVLARPTQKYSKSYRSKQQPQSQPLPQPSIPQPEKKETLKFDSLSYTDLLANYCFSGGVNESNAIKQQVSSSVPSSPNDRNVGLKNENVFGLAFASSCSPASTFHSFSDSIHI
ncbi:carbohydrate-binding module family 21 protein [Suhomyces tanzawaensis NRRL Y-17324]|uniref:Carbohydrate-binding module family 21 protein n=1 Tax=Suhomyces tanzawaensis NRRL Y-17324 TaxID=984487 RepID=A0A1E4SHW4_9ASCO|nr:carbohydrate-binding module family 21 protein [Suhomyces tanzawaensis NRRL Y-17324]ODV79086.1 carbohydrate-binding module family 21 protein [Suhomyces tanzawaensis NRRL Y-17324]